MHNEVLVYKQQVWLFFGTLIVQAYCKNGWKCEFWWSAVFFWELRILGIQQNWVAPTLLIFQKKAISFITIL